MCECNTTNIRSGLLGVSLSNIFRYWFLTGQVIHKFYFICVFFFFLLSSPCFTFLWLLFCPPVQITHSIPNYKICNTAKTLSLFHILYMHVISNLFFSFLCLLEEGLHLICISIVDSLYAVKMQPNDSYNTTNNYLTFHKIYKYETEIVIVKVDRVLMIDFNTKCLFF